MTQRRRDRNIKRPSETPRAKPEVPQEAKSTAVPDDVPISELPAPKEQEPLPSSAITPAIAAGAGRSLSPGERLLQVVLANANFRRLLMRKLVKKLR